MIVNYADRNKSSASAEMSDYCMGAVWKHLRVLREWLVMEVGKCTFWRSAPTKFLWDSSLIRRVTGPKGHRVGVKVRLGLAPAVIA